MALKHRLRRLLIRPGAVILRWGVRVVSASYRLQLADGCRSRIGSLPEPAIIVCWHDQMLLSAPAVLREILPRRALSILASHSDDGELVTRVAIPFGVRVVRGSTSRGGRAGMRKLHQDLVRHRSTLFLMPDGPRGPAHVAKSGCVVLSQLARAPLVPVAFAGTPCRRVGSWDRLALPWPFARIRGVVGEPIEVPRELPTELRESLTRELQETLEKLTKQAEREL